MLGAAGERIERRPHEVEVVRELDDVVPDAVLHRGVGGGVGAIGAHEPGPGRHRARVAAREAPDLGAVRERRAGDLAPEPRGATENENLSHVPSLLGRCGARYHPAVSFPGSTAPGRPLPAARAGAHNGSDAIA
ncbi:MAG: hypothetical protein KDB08_07550 [Microthrixaceae bacterium]|nr:hypothetical protein [Microthrixaceae bacterium]